MDGLKSLLILAERPWWGSTHPGDYLCRHPDTEQRVGIGLLARSDFSTFNIWFYGTNCPSASEMTFRDAVRYVAVWTLAKQFGEVLHDGHPLSEWSMVLTIDQFDALARRERFKVAHMGRWYQLGTDLERQFNVVAPLVLIEDSTRRAVRAKNKK